jgi:hypothetical protein
VHSFSGDDPIACRDYVRSKLGLPERKPNGACRANGKSRASGKAPAKPYSPTVATFVYRDQEGKPYLQVQRTAAKDFFQSHWTGENWKSGAPKGPKIPYRLPQLIAASTPQPVYIVEGEGKAERLAKLGFVATSASGGAEKWAADLNEWFRDRHVRILIDNDAPGRKHGQLVAKNLDGIAASVRVVELPGLPEKGDVKEWLANDPTGARLVQICELTPVWEPIVGATAKDEEAVAELAALAPLHYAKRRKWAAEAIGIRVGELDAIVAKARGEASVPSSLPCRWEIERWDEMVDTAELLSTLRDTFAQHVVLPEHGAVTMALWTLHAWAIDAACVSPFLMFSAPEMRCGKSTALALIYRTGPRTAFASNISPAAVFRYIEAHHPTLIVDEADSFVQSSEELRGILNSGHTRDTAFIIRCEGDDHTPAEFSTWAPKAIAAIGKLAATLQDRSIVLHMKRKKPDERVTKLRREDAESFNILRRKASRWIEGHLEILRNARPDLPAALNDRAQDNWEPLLAIADLAGGEWPSAARAAALKLSAEAETGTASLKTLLLADIKVAFEGTEDRMTSIALVAELTKDPTSRWAEFGRTGKPLTQKKLATLLDEFGIKPKNMRVPGVAGVAKGYEKRAFDDVFERYLPRDTPLGTATSKPTSEFSHLEPRQTATSDLDVAVRSDHKSLETNGSSGVADRAPPLCGKGPIAVSEDHTREHCQRPVYASSPTQADHENELNVSLQRESNARSQGLAWNPKRTANTTFDLDIPTFLRRGHPDCIFDRSIGHGDACGQKP